MRRGTSQGCKSWAVRLCMGRAADLRITSSSHACDTYPTCTDSTEICAQPHLTVLRQVSGHERIGGQYVSAIPYKVAITREVRGVVSWSKTQPSLSRGRTAATSAPADSAFSSTVPSATSKDFAATAAHPSRAELGPRFDSRHNAHAPRA